MQLTEILGGSLRLRHFVVVVAIAEYGSMREASEVLYLTQPAASRALRELEEALGLVMFDRGPKGMSPTPAGAALLPHLQAMMAECGSLLRHADEISGGRSGEVRIGNLLAGAADVVPLAIVSVCRRFDGVRVAVLEGTPDVLHQQLMLGALDLIVGRVTPIASMPGVAVEPLFDDVVNVVCSADHRFAAGAGRLGDLVQEWWVLPPTDTSLRQQVEAAFIRECGERPSRIVECVAPVPLKRLLQEGEHLSVVPSGVFHDEIRRGQFVALELEIPGTAVPVGVITRAGAELSPAARSLVGAIRDAAEETHSGVSLPPPSPT